MVGLVYDGGGAHYIPAIEFTRLLFNSLSLLGWPELKLQGYRGAH